MVVQPKVKTAVINNSSNQANKDSNVTFTNQAQANNKGTLQNSASVSQAPTKASANASQTPVKNSASASQGTTKSSTTASQAPAKNDAKVAQTSQTNSAKASQATQTNDAKASQATVKNNTETQSDNGATQYQEQSQTVNVYNGTQQSASNNSNNNNEHDNAPVANKNNNDAKNNVSVQSNNGAYQSQEQHQTVNVYNDNQSASNSSDAKNTKDNQAVAPKAIKNDMKDSKANASNAKDINIKDDKAQNANASIKSAVDNDNQAVANGKQQADSDAKASDNKGVVSSEKVDEINSLNKEIEPNSTVQTTIAKNTVANINSKDDKQQEQDDNADADDKADAKAKEFKNYQKLNIDATKADSVDKAIDNNKMYSNQDKKALKTLVANGKLSATQSKNLPNVFAVKTKTGSYLAVRSTNNAITLIPTVLSSNNDLGTIYGTGHEIYLPENHEIYTQHMWATIDGKTADVYCLQPLAYGPLELNHSTSAPVVLYNDTKTFDNPNNPYNELLGVDFYGYQGPQATVPNTDDGYLYTHIAEAVAAWDSNYGNMKGWESDPKHPGYLTQAEVDSWRNIPQVKALLDKAKGFNVNVAKKDGWTFDVYQGHGAKNGQMIPNSQLMFMVKWNKIPKSPAPTITTTLNQSQKNTIAFSSNATATDVVKMSNLTPNTNYTIKGTLYDEATGKPVVVNGKEITAETSFKSNGNPIQTQNVVFHFDSTGLTGHKLVAEEQLIDNGKVVASDTNIHDTAETDIVNTPTPTITTTLNQGEKNMIAYSTNAKATDVVQMTDLLPNQSYTIKGTLYDEATGKPALVNGKEITAETTFKSNGEKQQTQNVVFNFDSTGLAGHKLVAEEQLINNGKVVASDSNLHDTAETDSVITPTIGTTFAGKAHEVIVGTSAKAVDVVAYQNLQAGQTYTIKGTLYDQATGKPALVNGKEITATQTFKAPASSGTVDVTFTFNDEHLQGHKLVAFEDLYNGKSATGTAIIKHDDIHDHNEVGTVNTLVPTIQTTLTGKDGKHILTVAPTQTIMDKVAYTGLTIGDTYTIKGVLYNQANDKPVIVDGKEVTGTKTFVATQSNGVEEVPFTFNDETLQGDKLVAFEDLYHNSTGTGTPVVKHEDIHDTAETDSVTKLIPTMQTTLTGSDASNPHMLPANSIVTVTDKVVCTNLIPNQSYKLVGTLMNKATGAPLLINGKPVTASIIFTPKTPNWSVDLPFTFNDTGLDGAQLVAYENLYNTYTKRLVVAHDNINDMSETDMVKKPIKQIGQHQEQHQTVNVYNNNTPAQSKVVEVTNTKVIKEVNNNTKEVPTPVVEASKPAPQATPAPVVETSKPAPVVEASKPAPQATPAPVVEASKPAPQATPAPAVEVSKPAPQVQVAQGKPAPQVQVAQGKPAPQQAQALPETAQSSNHDDAIVLALALAGLVGVGASRKARKDK